MVNERTPQSLDEWLQLIRRRPGMYLRDNSLSDLETLIHGYEMALLSHGDPESRAEFNSEFCDFLRNSRGWSLSCGWAAAISAQSSNEDDALELFYEILKEFYEATGASQR